ncbi:MAG TPA: hypothetical protein VFH16_21060 [Rubrobacter sp.]|nr:hypothetical protein [Rubrobacter sp.]
MAVIVRKTVDIGGSDVELKTYQPPGSITKEERLRADYLDNVLSERVPRIAAEVLEEAPEETGLVWRWYTLGRKLREIIDNRELVASTDVHSGLVWVAVWYYLPDSMRPADSTDAKPYPEKQHKRKDHLSLCYEISGFEWPEVQWIKRWDDWHQLAFRPGMLRDKRIIRAVGERISRLPHYPSRQEFREIVKVLGEAFPTRRLRDSTFLADVEIALTVEETVQAAIPQQH